MEETWAKTLAIFPILNQMLTENEISRDEFQQTVAELAAAGILDHIYEIVYIEIDQMLRHQTVPKFWSHFQPDAEGDGFEQFQYAVKELFVEYTKYQQIVKTLQAVKQAYELRQPVQDDFRAFDEMFRSSLLSQLPVKHFNAVVAEFYVRSFKVFTHTHSEVDEFSYLDEEDFLCRGCNRPTVDCNCQELVSAFTRTNQYLTEMGILDRLAGYSLTELIQEKISRHVQDTCKGSFDASHIAALEKWLNTIVLQWLLRIFNKGSLKLDERNAKICDAVKNFQVKLNYYLYEEYANTIIDQFFNIIIEYPDSQPAIDDLKVCLEKIDLREHLIKTLKHSLETRLLHPGVDTPDILTGYVAAIKTIRHLDSGSGILLHTVTEPVKEYLRSRSDTVRCVVTALTEEGPTDLAEELAKSEALKAEEAAADRDEMLHWEQWRPDPIDVAVTERKTRSNRPSDIISMVVDIYGSKELFVNEYRNLLAERLLMQLDFNPEKEIRNLELLKLRFGETLLHSCEVMLKDLSDSKRINTHIHTEGGGGSGEEGSFEISALIVSSQFWPTFKKETMELPEQIKEQFDKYTKSYEAYKGNRTLCWTPLNGKVSVELELDDRKLELTVSPAQATIILHFETQKEWHLDKLSALMNVPPTVLRKRMIFWQTQGVIREQAENVFVLVDRTTGGCGGDIEMQNHTHDEDDEEAESAMASASDQREEELQVFWSYIVGMLTNLDSLPLERIHQMLKMFASQGPGFEFSHEELKNFLQRKVREHKLVYAGAVYHLPKA